jgi:hypothetical protein
MLIVVAQERGTFTKAASSLSLFKKMSTSIRFVGTWSVTLCERISSPAPRTGVGTAFTVGSMVQRKRDRYYPLGHFPVALVGSIM